MPGPPRPPAAPQLINFFALDEERRLVDLPGYGYAKVAKSKRNEGGRSTWITTWPSARCWWGWY